MAIYRTAREVYINVLTELVKEEAPTIYLEDFNYYFNKAISEYLKVRYELFEVTQQLTDDLRFWKEDFKTDNLVTPLDDIAVSEGKPYRHLLSCTIDASTDRPIFGCDQKAGSSKTYKAPRVSSAIKAGILDNVYLEAAFYRPYFDISNNKLSIILGGSVPYWVKISNITIEYLRHPAVVDLLEAEVAANADTSQVLEFTYDVGEEIEKILLKILLERGTNPRLQSNAAISQTINDPVARAGIGQQ